MHALRLPHLSSASFVLAPWVLKRDEVITSTCSLLIRFADVLYSEASTFGGIHAAASTSDSRNSALVATLFTFCPPAPPDRE